MLQKLLVAMALAALATPIRAQALEVEAGSPLAIETLTVRAEVDEGVALVDVDQVFRNNTDAVQEGVYRFRLPEQAVVHSFSMWIEGKEKHGRVLEAAKARQVYDSIVRRRKDPALLEEIGWRRFQVSVFPIPARDTVRIRLVYAHVVDDDLGLRTLEIPLPEGTPVGVADVSVRVRDRQGVALIDCPSHADADVLSDDVLGAVTWSHEGYTATGPFRVRSAPAVKGLGLACLAYRPEGSAEGTFLVRVVPRLDDVPDLPRDVVFVIDRSGSMRGPKLEQAQAALRYGLATLRPGDRFSVVAFSSGVQVLGEGRLAPATEEWRDEARAFTDALTASGGTNIDGALQRAASMRSEDPGRLFVVSFLTDGNPTVGERDPDRIVSRYRASSAGNVRLFAFGVGADVKDFLLTRLAKESRGAAEYVRENEDLEVKLSALFEKVRSPVLTDVSVRVTGDDVHVLGVEPEVLPDVFRGTAVVAAGRYAGSGPARIRLTGRVGATPVETSLDVTLPSVAAEKPHVAQLWARMRIDRLLDELRLHGMVEEIRQEIIALGVQYQVVSPYTSFLVVEDGIHIPDDGELARVPEGPGGPTAGRGGNGTTVHVFGRKKDTGRVQSATDAVPPDSREPSDPPPAPDHGPTSPGGETAGSETGGPTTGGGGSSGGAYRGPAGEAPSGSGNGGTGGGDSGGGAGASAGGTDSGGAALGGGAGRGKSAGAGGAGYDYSWWRYWWQAHRDALRGDSDRGGPAVSLEVQRTVILPALRGVALSSDTNFLVRAECQRALALWRDDSEPVRTLAERMLADAPADGEPLFHRYCEERSPRLFVAPELDGASRARLLNVLADADGRRASVRAYAALALGLGGPDASGDVVAALSVAAGVGPRAQPDVRIASIFALGLLGDERATPLLLAMLDDSARGDVEVAYAVDALGRLGMPGAADGLGRGAITKRLLDLLEVRGRRAPAMVVLRSVPAALARIAEHATPRDQADVVDALQATWRDARDTSLAASALLAAGRIGASAAVQPDVARAARSALASEWSGKRRSQLRAFNALALGRAAAADQDDPLRALLRQALTSGESSDVVGAAVVAIGTLRDRAAVPALRGLVLDAARSPDVVADAIDALARWNDAASIPKLIEISRTLAYDDDVRFAARAALVRLGDRGARQATLEALEREELEAVDADRAAREIEVIAAGATADTAERLARIVRDEDARLSDRTRALAARALGRMAGTADLRRRIADDFPYRAWCEPIWTFMDWR